MPTWHIHEQWLKGGGGRESQFEDRRAHGTYDKRGKKLDKGSISIQRKIARFIPPPLKRPLKSIIRFDVNAIVDLSSLRSLLQTLHLQLLGTCTLPLPSHLGQELQMPYEWRLSRVEGSRKYALFAPRGHLHMTSALRGGRAS